MALNEILKGNALAQINGNAGAVQESGYVTLNTLRQILFELFGTGQSGITLPAGFTGGTFPGGDTVTGTLPMVRSIDVASLNSPAGSPANLKSFVVPGGVLSATGFRGFTFEAFGSVANNANAKTLTVAFGGSAAQTTVAMTASTTNDWHIVGGVYVRSATSVVLTATGSQGPSTPSAGGVDIAVTGLTLTNNLTLQIACTQTSAADVIQDGLIITYIP